LIHSVQGIPQYIYTDELPMSYEDAMSLQDSQGWAEAHHKEFKGFKDRNAITTVLLPKGALARALGTSPLCYYKAVNGIFSKRKVHMCV
jgi:hypothetical protein